MELQLRGQQTRIFPPLELDAGDLNALIVFQ